MSKKSIPFFSIIVPVYNNGPDLEKCISSILKQSCTDFELILIDDCSTDCSSGICDRFACNDNRVQVIHKEKNEGTAAARNTGLFKALGKYVFYVDGDDWIVEELLEQAKVKLVEEEALDLYVFCYAKVLANGNYEKKISKFEEGIYDKEKLKKEVYPEMISSVKKKIQSGIDTGSLCNKIIRRKLLEKHYCRNVSLFRGEDSVCAWECLYYADKIYFSDSIMYFYNCMNCNSSTKKYHANLYENNKAVAQYLREHLNEKGNLQIWKQINALEFRGMVGVIHQEIDFHHSIYNAASFLKEKCKGKICSREGLPLYVQPYICALNLHFFLILLLCAVLKRYLDTVINMVKIKAGI